MEELLLNILACLAEVLLEMAGEVILEAAWWAMQRLGASLLRGNPVAVGFVVAIAGIAAGCGSAFLFPHPLVHPSRFHGISLVISPVITGVLMAGLGSARRRLGRKPVEVETFAYGFIFALGMACVRFALVR
jgi:hypothetical protein